MPNRPLIVATNNPGKLREFKAMLEDFPFEVNSLGELGIASPEESGATFLENAMLKARHASAAAAAAGFAGASMGGVAALADDSGLEVDALGGAPGIFSARYAGEDADDAANNAKLIAALAGIPAERRGARYRCALVLFSGDNVEPLIAEGVWEGHILESPRGAGGFGYDPYFFLADRRRTAAELGPEEKNRLSHRGIAMRELRELLQARDRLPARGQPR